MNFCDLRHFDWTAASALVTLAVGAATIYILWIYTRATLGLLNTAQHQLRSAQDQAKTAQEQLTASFRPIVVATIETDTWGKPYLRVANAGSGPALNITFGHGTGFGTHSLKQLEGIACLPAGGQDSRLPELAPDTENRAYGLPIGRSNPVETLRLSGIFTIEYDDLAAKHWATEMDLSAGKFIRIEPIKAAVDSLTKPAT